MGSPLASLLANWFIISKENAKFKSYIKTKPMFYTRYVDDIYVLMENNHNLDTFYNKMSTTQPYMQFTLERPNDNKLPFPDTEIKKSTTHQSI